ncbi:hypothetical protein [Zhongshania sp.]|uniref:hypothetical protein n=1 Tax=Zhongshania sp. TaxID=1971902 RepID=UPI001B7ACAC6|nr:hypothetical protein [Zhongshania sp.]MBQ0797405.1 hypothetical protein [Zhongshania sp.]
MTRQQPKEKSSLPAVHPRIPFKFLRPRDRLALLGENKSSDYRKRQAGLLPEMVELGPRTKGTPDYELEIIQCARLAGANEDEMRELVKAIHEARSKIDWRAMLCRTEAK